MPYKKRFHKKLTQVFQELIDVHGYVYNYLSTYALDGGKQIRPMLFLETISHWKGDIDDDDILVACALELLHIFFLIHDDVMDNDEMRRDKLTLHAHFVRSGMLDGVGRAVVWGDVLFCKALQLLGKHSDQHIAFALIQNMLDVSEETAQGQLLEANREKLPNMAELLHFYAKKTALYSVYLPLISAAIVTHKEDQKNTILSFSSELGIAFQLYDDLIEVTGEKKRQEHSDRCGDIMRLKATPLLIGTLPHLKEGLIHSLKEKYHTNQITTLDEENQVLEAMKTHGVVHDACVQIQEYAAKAKRQAEDLGIDDIELIEKLILQYTNVSATHAHTPS